MRKVSFMSYGNNKGADQPAHPRSLISTFVVLCLDSTTPLIVIFKISRLQLAYVAEQAGLNLTWSKSPDDMFSCDVAHLPFSLHLLDTWATSWQNQQMSVCPAKTRISLGIHPVLSESSLCTRWVAKDPSFLHADSEDSDQPGRRLWSAWPRLIWVFAQPGCTVTWLVLSCCGSCYSSLLDFKHFGCQDFWIFLVGTSYRHA